MYYEPKIIIIADDDDDDSLFLFQALLLLPDKFTIITVSNGESLVNMLESVSPHYIFLDVNMPKMNGFDALRHIRTKKGVGRPTVIMCSTSDSINSIRLCEELGADMYIKKPNSISHLNKMIEHIFSKKWSGMAEETIPSVFFLHSTSQCV